MADNFHGRNQTFSFSGVWSPCLGILVARHSGVEVREESPEQVHPACSAFLRSCERITRFFFLRPA